MKSVKLGIAVMLLVQPLQAGTLADLPVSPDDLTSECGYSWRQKPELIDPDTAPLKVDSLLLEWLGPDSPVARSALDTIVSCVYASPNDTDALRINALS